MPVAGMSRRDLYDSINSAVALDIIFVTMLRMYSRDERPYYETRDEYTKQMRKAAVDPVTEERERVKKNIVAMAKYRKAR